MVVRTPQEVGLLIRERRREIGLTQAELAERVGSSREWIRLAESGKPRLDLALALRALGALGITLDAREQVAATPHRSKAPVRKAKPGF
jgi:HTH-type transcriptional regulator / antitoxin HipB